jgi:hypothetical protein
MKGIRALLLFLVTLAGASTTALADNGDAGAACAGVGCGLVIYLVILAVCLGGAVALVIFIIRWIKNDATSRGMPNADSVKWFGLLGLLGLVIYLLQRPDGMNQVNQVSSRPCPSCGLNRMDGLAVCPHCGKP